MTNTHYNSSMDAMPDRELVEYIAPELFLLLMTSLFIFQRCLFSAIIFYLCIIIFLLVVPVTYLIHT